MPARGNWLYSLEQLIEKDQDLSEVPDQYLPRDETTIDWTEIDPHIERLPPRDQDVINLCLKYKIGQNNIGKLFNITQGAISYILHRAIQRLQFLQTIPLLNREEFHRTCKGFLNHNERLTMWGFYLTTSDTEVGRILGKSQVQIRNLIIKAIEGMKRSCVRGPKRGKGKLEKYIEVFDALRAHTNILWHVETQKHPNWELNHKFTKNDFESAETRAARKLSEEKYQKTGKPKINHEKWRKTEKYRIYKKQYGRKGWKKETKRAYMHRFYLRHKEKILARNKKRRDAVRAYNKKYYCEVTKPRNEAKKATLPPPPSHESQDE